MTKVKDLFKFTRINDNIIINDISIDPGTITEWSIDPTRSTLFIRFGYDNELRLCFGSDQLLEDAMNLVHRALTSIGVYL